MLGLALNYGLSQIQMRDPRTGCGSINPFGNNLGYSKSYGYRQRGNRVTTGNGKKSGFSLKDFAMDVAADTVLGGLGGLGFYKVGKHGAGAGSERGTPSVAKPNQGQGFSSKGYNPQPGERTFEGYVKQTSDPEISLYTKSSGFNNNPKGTGGQFKRFGANEHYGLAPHVHQPVRNVTPNGMIFGRTGKDVGIDVFSPNKKDIEQLYECLNNGKYHE